MALKATMAGPTADGVALIAVAKSHRNLSLLLLGARAPYYGPLWCDRFVVGTISLRTCCCAALAVYTTFALLDLSILDH